MRLLARAASQEPLARWLLDQVGVQPGWRVADVGCGPVGILDLLAEKVGVDGTVIGVEREVRFIGLLRRAGFMEVRAEVHVAPPQPGDEGRTNFLSLVGGVQRRIVERGLLSETELATQIEALRQHLRDPAILVIRPLHVQAWGRKPG